MPPGTEREQNSPKSAGEERRWVCRHQTLALQSRNISRRLETPCLPDSRLSDGNRTCSLEISRTTAQRNQRQLRKAHVSGVSKREPIRHSEQTTSPGLWLNLWPSQHKPPRTFFQCVCSNLGNPAKAPFSLPGGTRWRFGSTSLSKGRQARDPVQLCVQRGTVGGFLWVTSPLRLGSPAHGGAGHFPTAPPRKFSSASRKTPGGGRADDSWSSQHFLPGGVRWGPGRACNNLPRPPTLNAWVRPSL